MENRRMMNLQLFGESGAGDEGAQGAEARETGEEPKAGRTFTQEDMDRLAQKIRAEERRKLEEETSRARSEGERLARMNAEERARHEAEEREKSLRQREAEIAQRELRAAARDLLAEKDLPGELLEVVNLTSAESVAASIAGAEKAFRAAVQLGVEERLKGTTPKKDGGQAQGAAELEARIRSAMGLKPKQ